MRLAAKTDRNHKALVAAFRGMGCSVLDLSRVGRGCPDILIGVDQLSVLVEIKDGKNALTADQEAFFSEWRGSKVIVRNVEEAGVLVKAIRALAGPMSKVRK